MDIGGIRVNPVHCVPIEYVYYSEADQIVRFDSALTVRAIKAASNATTYFLGIDLFIAAVHSSHAKTTGREAP